MTTTMYGEKVVYPPTKGYKARIGAGFGAPKKKWSPVDKGSYYAIPLSNSILMARIDKEDIHKIFGSSWYLDKDGYAISEREEKTVLMSRLIMNAPKGLEVDHLYHNRLDNRKSRLRICTHDENMNNRRSR